MSKYNEELYSDALHCKKQLQNAIEAIEAILEKTFENQIANGIYTLVLVQLNADLMANFKYCKEQEFLKEQEDIYNAKLREETRACQIGYRGPYGEDTKTNHDWHSMLFGQDRIERYQIERECAMQDKIERDKIEQEDKDAIYAREFSKKLEQEHTDAEFAKKLSTQLNGKDF